MSANAWGTLAWEDVGVVIRAVPGKREDLVVDTLRAASTFAPNVKVSYHQEDRNLHEAYVDALDSWGREFPWTLHLEDDVWLAPDFPDRALEALLSREAARSSLVSLYSSQVKDADLAVVEAPALRYESKRFLCAVAIAFPTRVLDSHNDHVIGLAEAGFQPSCDAATADWLKVGRRRWSRLWPSIVQHVGNEVSLMGHAANWNRCAPSYSARYGEDHL